MSNVCPACGFHHAPDDAAAVDRFEAHASGYRSTLMPDAPLRETRAEAEADTCQWREAQ